MKIKPADTNSITTVHCPKCDKFFALVYDELDTMDTLSIGSCQSGGIYRITIVCPFCRHKEDID